MAEESGQKVRGRVGNLKLFPGAALFAFVALSFAPTSPGAPCGFDNQTNRAVDQSTHPLPTRRKPESQMLQLVGKPEYEADIRLGLNVPSIENRWTVAPFMNRSCCSSHKQRRATHRFDALHFPVLADRGA
jgi:hypothetical protein